MEYVFEQENLKVKIFAAGLTLGGLAILVVGFVWMTYRQRQSFWKYGVRLPSQPNRPCWYLIALSVGCRPWAGHEGNIYVRLIGSQGESESFLINGEPYSRLYEANSHLYIYASPQSLGEINYVNIVCGASSRKKKWFLSSVHIFGISQIDRGKHWYFPYHKWIEVFLDPVRITLCGVDVYHDIHKRLLLGWLGRGFTDFHLWFSIFGPLKYSQFNRSQRYLCCVTFLIALTAVCMYLNTWIPNLGVFILGIYSSVFTALPIYICEWLFRMTSRKPRVLKEDLYWYTDYASSPISYKIQNQEKIDEHEARYIVCPRDTRDQDHLLKEFQAHEGILINDDIFWTWLNAVGETAESDHSLSEFISAHDLQSLTVPLTTAEKIKKNIKTVFNYLNPIEYLSSIFSSKPTTESSQDLENTTISRTSQSQRASILRHRDSDKFYDSSADYSSSFDQYMGNRSRESKRDWIDLKQNNFQAKPMVMWRVDSNYSLANESIDKGNLDKFSLLESMPVGHFDRLRPGHRSLLAGKKEAQQYGSMQDSNAPTDHVYRKLVSPVSKIKLPPEAQHLSFEEGALVSELYFDLSTKSHQWLKPGVPMQLFTADTNIKPATDWMKIEVASQDDFDEDWQPMEFKGGENEQVTQRMDLEKLQRLYPEPIRRIRVFSMLMFPEYASKLSKAYEEMAQCAQLQSYVSDMFVLFGNSKEICCIFCDACVEIALHSAGRQALSSIFSGARQSMAWSKLICSLAQRLQFQGDNIRRIRRKYGLDADCQSILKRGDETKEKACYEEYRKNYGDTLSRTYETKGVQNDTSSRLYYEMDRMHIWSKKLEQLNISSKCWAFESLCRGELTCLSRFFRTMIQDEDGCILFIELLLQVSLNQSGLESISGIFQSVASQCDGVERIASFHKAVGESGLVGRKLLLRLYGALKRQSPYGTQIMQRVADCLEAVPTGKLLLTDLQVEGKKAVRIALRIKSEIRSNLHPLVKLTTQYLSHVILRMNEIARCMLTVTNHARAVLEKGDGDNICKTDLEKGCHSCVGQAGSMWSNNIWNSRFQNCQKHSAKDDVDSVLSHYSLKGRRATSFNESSPCKNLKYFRDSTTRPINNFTQENEICMSCYDKDENTAQRVENGCVKNKSLLSKLTGNISKFNEFFLQSKNYENFYMNFFYRPPCQSCAGPHGSASANCNQDCPKLLKNKSTMQTNEADVKKAAVKWGRDVVVKEGKKEEIQSKVSKCTCPDESNGCVLCSVANQISDAKNSSEAMNIISDIMKECPSTSRKLFQGSSNNPKNNDSRKFFPFWENRSDTCPEIATLYHNSSMGSFAPTNCSCKHSQHIDSSVQPVKTVGNYIKSYFGIGDSTERRFGSSKSVSETLPFPSSGTQQLPSTQKQLRGNVNPTIRNGDLALLWKHMLSKSSEKEEALKELKDDAKQIYSQKSQSTLSRPITAKEIRESELTYDNAPESDDSSKLGNNKKDATCSSSPNTHRPAEKERKIYPSLRVPARNAPQEYWEEGSENGSEFSRPDLKYKDEMEYCEQCGGEVEVKKLKDLTYTYRYLINRDKGKRQGHSASTTTCSDDASWEDNDYDNNTDNQEQPPVSALPSYDKSDNEEYQRLRYHNSCSNSYNKITEHVSSILQRWIPLEESIFPNLQSEDSDDDDESFVTVDTFHCHHHSYITESTDKPASFKNDQPNNTNENIESLNRGQLECGSISCGSLNQLRRLYYFVSSSVISDCQLRNGTQESPTSNRYLLPLKAVRSYEEAVKKFGKKKFKVQCPSVVTDSGVSMDNNSVNLIDSGDEGSEVDYPQNKTLMKLMGISQGIGKVSYPPSTCYSYMSTGSCQAGPCFQSKRLKRFPILLLQGFGCEPLLEHPNHCRAGDNSQQCLNLNWWKQHDVALQLVQQSVDSCVRFSVLIAQTRKDVITEHEQTCKTCAPRIKNYCCFQNHYDVTEKMGGKVLGLRYSEMLPSIWRAEIHEMGQTNERKNENQIPRFYHKLVQAAVESTRVLLLVPDMHGSKKQKKTSHKTYKTSPGVTSICSSTDVCELDRRDTAFHLEKLAQFREMILSLNKLRKKVSKTKKSHLISDDDIRLASKTQITKTTLKNSIRACSVFEKINEVHLQEKIDPAKKTIVDSLTDYVKGKMCGSVQDCCEVLNYPWQFPIEEQHRTGGFLSGIMEFLKQVTGSSDLDVATEEGAMQGAIESYLGEIIFKATTQTNIQKAVKQATVVKQYLANLELITSAMEALCSMHSTNSDSLRNRQNIQVFRLCLAKIQGYSSTIEHAIQNTRNIIKKCLETMGKEEIKNEFTEEWWSKEYHQSQDTDRHDHNNDSQSTMDDVLIGFERLRRHIHCDLCLANFEVLSMEHVTDQQAFTLFKGTRCKVAEKKQFDAYDVWTESEVSSKSKKSFGKNKNSKTSDTTSGIPNIIVTSTTAASHSNESNIDLNEKDRNFDTEIRRSKPKTSHLLEVPGFTTPVLETENYYRNGLSNSSNRKETLNESPECRMQNIKVRKHDTSTSKNKTCCLQDKNIIFTLNNKENHIRSSFNEDDDKNISKTRSSHVNENNKHKTATARRSVNTTNKLKNASEELLAETTLIRDDKSHEIVDVTTTAPKPSASEESFDVEGPAVPSRLRVSHVTEKKEDSVASARPAMKNMSEDTIEETILIRDLNSHEIVDVINRKLRVDDANPYPSGNAQGMESEDNISSATLSDKLDTDSFTLSVSANSDVMGYVTCGSFIDLMSETEETNVNDPEIKRKTTCNDDPVCSQKCEKKSDDDATECCNETFIPENNLHNRLCKTTLCDKTTSPVSQPLCSSNVSKTGHPEKFISPSAACQDSNSQFVNASQANNNNFAKVKSQKVRNKRRVKNNLAPSGWFWDQTESDEEYDSLEESESTSEVSESYSEESGSTESESSLERIQEPGYVQEQYLGLQPQPIELLNFNDNISSLVQLQCGQILPFWTSILVQLLLCAMAVAATYFACHMAYVEGYNDESLFWSVPIAIFVFAIVLEPLKCLGIAWILFLFRRIPAFYSSPVFIKSNPLMVLRGSVLKPKSSIGLPKKEIRYTLSAVDYQDALYRKYVENRPRPYMAWHRRRVLPALAESDILLRLEKVQSFDGVKEAFGRTGKSRSYRKWI